MRPAMRILVMIVGLFAAGCIHVVPAPRAGDAPPCPARATYPFLAFLALGGPYAGLAFTPVQSTPPRNAQGGCP